MKGDLNPCAAFSCPDGIFAHSVLLCFLVLTKKKKSLVVFGWFLFFYTKKKYLTSKRNLCLQSVTEKVAIQLQIHS